MGKSSAPKTPDYTGQAIATANSQKYDEVSPYGTVGWTMRPGADPKNPQPGDYIRTTELSAGQQGLYDQTLENQLRAGNVASGQFGQLQGSEASRQALQDSLYKRSTRYYDQNFGDQEAALRSQLLNSGLAQGSEAYDKAMRNFSQQRDTAYGDAANTAVINAEQQSQNNQNNAVARLAQILAMSRGQAPVSANSAAGGMDLLGAAQAQYQSELGKANAENAQSASTVGTVGNLAMMAMMYF